MLDCHPEIVGAPEFRNLDRIVELRNRLRQGIDRAAIDAFASAPEVDRLTVQLIEDLLLPLADRYGVPYLSEKTPSNALVFRELLDLFPAARCIFVLRDPRAIIASMLEVGARAAAQGHLTQLWTRSLSAAVAYVQRYFRAARAAEAEAPGRVLVLRYETLVTEPEADDPGDLQLPRPALGRRHAHPRQQIASRRGGDRPHRDLVRPGLVSARPRSGRDRYVEGAPDRAAEGGDHPGFRQDARGERGPDTGCAPAILRCRSSRSGTARRSSRA